MTFRGASLASFSLFVSAALTTLLTGCSTNFSPAVEPEEIPIGSIQGTVHGGQAPVSGASIYLYAEGTTGYGSAPTSLIKTTSPLPSGVSVDGLGQCPAAGELAAQVPYLVINEVTTVAFAYSMGGFATTAYNVSSNATASPGSGTAIANAMANTGNIVNLQWGQAPTVANGNSKSVNPQAKIYALANILATCVNTSGPTSSACAALFNASKNSAGTAPADEATAIFNIVHNPGQNVNTLYGLTPSQAVFSPSLSNQPTDWTLPVLYNNVLSQFGTNGSNQVTSGAYNIAFDASGNAWIGDRVKGVVEMSPLGAVSTYSIPNPVGSTARMAKGLAISPNTGNIWIADYGNSQVDIMSPAGSIVSTIPTSGNNLDGPSVVAFDDNGDGFAVNELNASIVVFTPTGGTPSTTGGSSTYSGGLTNINTPAWISIDSNDKAWIPSTNSAEIGQSSFTFAGGSGKFKGFSNTTMTAAASYGVVTDSTGNLWYATNAITGGGAPNNESLNEMALKKGNYSSAASESGSGYNGGGLGIPYKITVDGGNNIWMANEYYQTVSEWSTSLNQRMGVSGKQGTGFFGTGEVDATGYGNASSGTTLSAAPDNSGNMWLANTDGSVTVLLGAATPTANPIHPAVIGTEP